MSLIEQKIKKKFFYRNNPTLNNISKSYLYKKESLPTISYNKLPKINTFNNRNNLRLVQSPSIKRPTKNVLLSPIRNSQIEQTNLNKTDFITKVIIENPPSPNSVVFILDNYLKKEKYEAKYKLYNDINTMIFIFEEEKVALDFMKLIFQEKKTNPYYQFTTINVILSEKKRNSKFLDVNNKIAKEVLQRLYYGIGYEKKEKPKKKIIGNIQFSIESPYYNPSTKRMKKNFSDLNSLEKNLFNKKFEKLKINNYFGFDKKNKKFNINLLNTIYKSPHKVILRDEDKSKWMTPLNFNIY